MQTSPYALFFVTEVVVSLLVNVRYDDGSPIMPFPTQEAADQYVTDHGLTYESTEEESPFSLN